MNQTLTAYNEAFMAAKDEPNHVRVGKGLRAVVERLEGMETKLEESEAAAPNWILGVLKQNGITQAELARLVGTSDQYISMMATCKVSITSNMQKRILVALEDHTANEAKDPLVKEIVEDILGNKKPG